MSTYISSQELDDAISFTVPLSNYDTDSLCRNYSLRRHRWEAEANAGSHKARLDWIKYVGPTEQFGGCNPINGNFSALALPLTKPERMRLVAYVLEYIFLYDSVIELEKPDVDDQHDHFDHPERQEWKGTDPTLGRAQIQGKIMNELTSVDQACAERVRRTFKEAIALILREKGKQYGSLDEYLDFRLIDAGTSVIEALLLFGMGVTLTEEEDDQLEPIRKPGFIALALANDYLSFDREYLEFSESGQVGTLSNAVWLYMQWNDVDVDVAKRVILDVTRQNEDKFLENCANYRRENKKMSQKLSRHLYALECQISGNVVWSLNSPRYRPEARYDPNAGKPSIINPHLRIVNSRKSSSETCITVSDETVSIADSSCSRSSLDSVSSSSEIEQTVVVHSPKSVSLDSRYARAPVDYIKSLPSGGARDVFINALAVWFNVPPLAVSRVKSIGNRLHSASLILDDVEDRSTLRRGEPAAHAVFGVAQTINSGCYEFVRAVEEARQLGPDAVEIVLEGLDELHVGQSHDLYWTQNNLCPSDSEYLEMVKKKTGAMFLLLTRLLLTCSTSKESNKHIIADVEDLVSLIGIQYQIRDDYQNLCSKDYTEKRGFCQDLDEGKFSFPLIHALSVQSERTQLLRELLQRRRDAGHLSYEQKNLLLKQLDRTGSMSYTRETLKRLEGEVYKGVKKIEDATKTENLILRALLQRLEV
ncbi:isoprenoid synthase domain-containing protein [Bipolaris maydis]|nr:isoprenoid synthase domain-containing protein [Bipolaris maydis]